MLTTFMVFSIYRVTYLGSPLLDVPESSLSQCLKCAQWEQTVTVSPRDIERDVPRPRYMKNQPILFLFIMRSLISYDAK